LSISRVYFWGRWDTLMSVGFLFGGLPGLSVVDNKCEASSMECTSWWSWTTLEIPGFLCIYFSSRFEEGDFSTMIIYDYTSNFFAALPALANFDTIRVSCYVIACELVCHRSPSHYSTTTALNRAPYTSVLKTFA
jgi:hypothetical protein